MIEWKTSHKLIPLRSAVAVMEQRVLGIRNKTDSQLVWMLQHPHVYSGGTSSKASDIIGSPKVPVQLTGRGGSYTYHGPGQRIIYLLLDLNDHGKDVRKFVWNLEQWLIDTLNEVGIIGERREKRVGIWVCPKKGKSRILPKDELKIASIGLRVKNWISYFGASINVNPDLSYFDNIISCGNRGYGVTSIRQQGCNTSLTELDSALYEKFHGNFLMNGQLAKKALPATIKTIVEKKEPM